MSDPDTREEVVSTLKENCTLRSVLKPEKPCPYFGPSDTCHDCTYDWVTVVNEVLKLAKVRRASYEKERERIKMLESKLEKHEDLFTVVKGTVDCVGSIFRGIQEIVDAVSVGVEEVEDKDG